MLGVLEDEHERRQLVVADIPGLIEGASDGAGLGHDFLAHVERTRLLVHVLDVAPELSGGEDADALVNHAAIERELAAHDERLARLPRVLVLSKVDLVTPERARDAVARVAGAARARCARARDLQRHPRGRARAGGAAAADRARRWIRAATATRTTPMPPASVAAGTVEEELAEHMVFRPGGRDGGRGYVVERLGSGSFAVDGRGVERLLSRYDINNEDALAYLEGRLRRIGVLDALEREGFVAGDEVRIAGVVFELDPASD